LTLDKLGSVQDGQTVLVSAMYFEDAKKQILCDVLLESYPPMAGGNQLKLLGKLPDLIRSQLSTSVGEAGLAQETWGAVEVLGVYHSAAGGPFLEMQSVRIAPPQVDQPL
jgi:hypothetical protein